ncbi:MAG: sulfotransferase family 2 domain-containing protein [Chthoniobacterales bacterium]|nr:sulfotransferase family 2 domain-containing protein [Chthoniobacterales bacterium]
MTRETNDKALIFLHIPKTAGTTLNRIIEWQYDPRLIFTIDPFRIRATTGRLKTLSEERRRRLRVVRGHMSYGIHECLPQGGAYITMLRDPVARILSSYYFILRRPLHPLYRKLRAKGVGLEDYLEITAQRRNLQTKLVAGAPSVGPCDEHVLETAKQNLTTSFRVVGLSERFQESLLLIGALFGWDIPYYENRKVAKTRPAVDPAMVEMIREHNRYDIELYEFGRKRFEEDLRQNKEAIQQTALLTSSTPIPGKFESFVQSTLGSGRFLVSKVTSIL